MTKKEKSPLDPHSIQVLPMDNYTVHDIARIFEVNLDTARRWCRKGDIACIRRNGKFEVSKQALVDFTAKRYQ